MGPPPPPNPSGQMEKALSTALIRIPMSLYPRHYGSAPLIQKEFISRFGGEKADRPQSLVIISLKWTVLVVIHFKL